MRCGYFLSCEEYSPAEIIEQAMAAEDAGFEALWISDHFHPWNDEQGQSPFVWSVIGALSEAEAPAGQQRGRGGGLRDDRRVDPGGRAGDGRGDRQVADLGDGADDGPDERALALLVVPGVEVVGDPEAGEPGFLAADREVDELARTELLAGQEQADAHARGATRISAHI